MNKNIKFISDKITAPTERKLFHKFSAWVGIISVSLGTMAIIISLSILNGFEKYLKENAIKFTSHITLSGFGRRIIPDYDTKIKILKTNIPNVKNCYPVIQREALISSKSNVDGIIIKGINNDYSLGFFNNIVSGTSNLNQDKSLIIGNKLAQKLNIGIGDLVNLYTLKTSDFSLKTLPDVNKFKIVGIYQTGMAQYDDLIVFTSMNNAQKLLEIEENSASTIEIVLNDIDNIKAVEAKIESLIDYPYNLTNNFLEIHSSIFAWIDIQKEPIPIVLGLISIVAIFNIVTILLIVVVEKTKSIAILSSLGMNKSLIVQIFTIQGLKIGIKGFIIGSLISFAFSIIQLNFKIISLKDSIYFLDSLPIDINIFNYLFVFIFTLFITSLATLVPSFIAIRINPAKAFRFK